MSESKGLLGLNVDSKWTSYKAFSIVVLLWIASYPIVYFLFSSGKVDQSGQFGDAFGAINALFSGLAFAGIILTILLQRKELELQRPELKATRKEFKTQNIALKRQRFESTFFNMLSIHFSIVQSTSANTFVGLNAIDWFVTFYAQQINAKDLPKYNEDDYFKRHMELYQNIFASFNSSFSAYLQSIVAIYQSINGYSSKEEVRIRYYDILRSYISQQERTFLFYYILFSESTSTSKTLREIDLKFRITLDSNINFIKKEHTTFVNNPNRPYVI